MKTEAQLNHYLDKYHRLICQQCKKRGAERRRQNTAYQNDESNFATLCNECQEQANEYWAERWLEARG